MNAFAGQARAERNEGKSTSGVKWIGKARGDEGMGQVSPTDSDARQMTSVAVASSQLHVHPHLASEIAHECPSSRSVALRELGTIHVREAKFAALAEAVDSHIGVPVDDRDQPHSAPATQV